MVLSRVHLKLNKEMCLNEPFAAQHFGCSRKSTNSKFLRLTIPVFLTPAFLSSSERFFSIINKMITLAIPYCHPNTSFE